jgi:deferrochelatase/peroxidase EfeB
MAEPALSPRPAGADAAPSVDLADVQGLVRFGHGQLGEAVFLLLRVVDAGAAAAWLEAAPVTSAVTLEPPPDRALQIALTRPGLEAMRVPAAVIRDFSIEFQAGMAGEASRSRRLGDVGGNDPADWRWGGSEATVPHLAVLLYAREGGLAAWRQAACGEAFARAFTLQTELATNDIGEIEPFGFVDGLSQPRLDWRRSLVRPTKDRLRYGNLLALGEVLLGYPDEYGYYAERPLIEPGTELRAEALPPAEDDPARRDLARNGSYLVLRQLEQDVRGFWRFVDAAAGHDPGRRGRLAAAMVGRTRDGTPLVPRSPEAIDGTDPAGPNSFTFEGDPEGVRCPIGAHIRRANPRTPDLPGGPGGLLSRLVRILGFDREALRLDLVASTRFHRILRRGREYGPALPMEQALQPGDDTEVRGLHFICLCANIARQFEFVQGAWVNGAKFAGLADEADPLLGSRAPLAGGRPTARFTMPRADGLPERIEGLPPFVHVRGGAYFFLPGIRALRWIAGCAR